MSQIKPSSVPFGITNAVLAFALDLAGIPGAKPTCVNIYDENLLFALGGGEKDRTGAVIRHSRFEGMDIVEAAKLAFKDGESGSVTYRFDRVAKLSGLCKAFSDQEKKVADGETVNTSETMDEITKAMVAGEMDRAEGIVRMACLIIKTYVTFKNQWKGQTPLVRVRNAGRTTKTDLPDGSKLEVSPGWRTMSVNASAAVRKELGI
jgi:hypothetical protein